MLDHPCFNPRGDRPVDTERLAPGVRVRYDNGRWERNLPPIHWLYLAAVRYDNGRWERNLAMGGCYRFMPEWARNSWASTRVGTVVTVEDYSPFPDHHPWGCPSYATPVQFDGELQATWVRTSVLDAIGWAQPQEVEQLELELSFA